jgi:hypothetical protein
VNQVSLWFYAPRWRPRLTPRGKAFAHEGEPVHIVDAVSIPGADAPPIQPAVVKGWLAERGFSPVEWGRGSIFQSGQVWSIFGPEKEVEVNVGEEADEVTDVYCRFTFPRRDPPQLSDWAEFAAAWCGRFHLRLGAEGTTPCGEAEFLDVVRGDRNYQEFAAAFGWEGDQAIRGS